MSKQNGGEGGIIINMSSLAGKDNYHVNNDFLLVIGTTKVTLQSVFIINSGLKLKLGLLFFFYWFYGIFCYMISEVQTLSLFLLS